MKTGKFVLKREKKVKGRKYCPRCGTDITIIRLHDCVNGEQYGDYGNCIYRQYFMPLKDLIKRGKGRI